MKGQTLLHLKKINKNVNAFLKLKTHVDQCKLLAQHLSSSVLVSLLSSAVSCHAGSFRTCKCAPVSGPAGLVVSLYLELSSMLQWLYALEPLASSSSLYGPSF